MNEYHSEKFIEVYEHISRLKLLTDEELNNVKRKRNQFEAAVRSAVNLAPFIQYLKYEIALLKKFKQADYQNENDGRALDKALSLHVKELFRSALKRFSGKRKIWEHYISFLKQKLPNSVTNAYQEMLNFHHNKEDYIEAVRYEMLKSNYNAAIAILIQGISKLKDKDLVVLHIECSLEQADNDNDEKLKKNTLAQSTKFYEKFLKSCKDVKVHVLLIQKIQKFSFAISLQNEILHNILRVFRDRAEVWDVLAKRHLDGLIYEEDEHTENEIKEVSYEVRLRYALTIYDKSFEYVNEAFRKQMYSMYIGKLLELDASLALLSQQSLKFIRQALGKAIMNGYKEDNLSEAHFMYLLKLRILYKEKYQTEIEEMIEKGTKLYPNSMKFFELAIRYYLELKSFENIGTIFKFAVSNNEKNAVEMYKFISEMYLLDPRDKDKAKAAMMEAVKSNNKNLSNAFQPYLIEYCALTEGIEKTRELFNSLINSKAALSVEFFKTMVKIEEKQATPDLKMMKNCYERASEHFGKIDPEIWIDFMKFLWQQGQYSEATAMRQRAIEMLKNDLSKVEEFELKFTILKNECKLMLEEDVKHELDEFS